MNYLESKVKMNYLEIKVRELLEQVLRGEKRIPKLETKTDLSWEGNVVPSHSMVFGDNLTIKYCNNTKFLVSIINEDGRTWTIYLFEGDDMEDKKSTLERKIELEILFKGVWSYSERVENKLMWIDKVFGEIK